MSAWVLILFLGFSTSPHHVDFPTKRSCEHALALLKHQLKVDGNWSYVIGVCVPRGDQ